MSMWMYANVIFVVHYSPKDRSWTISFPFMRLPCWPAEWRYSNYSFPPAARCPALGVFSAMLHRCQVWKRSWHIAGQQRRSWVAIMKPLQTLVKQGDAELYACLTSRSSPAQVLHCESVWAGHKLTRKSIQALQFDVWVSQSLSGESCPLKASWFVGPDCFWENL